MRRRKKQIVPRLRRGTIIQLIAIRSERPCFLQAVYRFVYDISPSFLRSTTLNVMSFKVSPLPPK